jgi:hypothetical protein
VIGEFCGPKRRFAAALDTAARLGVSTTKQQHEFDENGFTMQRRRLTGMMTTGSVHQLAVSQRKIARAANLANRLASSAL